MSTEKPVASKWRLYAEKIRALAMDESFDLLDYPAESRAIMRLRNGVNMTSAGRNLRFYIRSLPTGGIRVIRAGTWGCAYHGTQFENTATHFPVLLTRASKTFNGLRSYFLGLLWGTSLHAFDIPFQRRCEEKACPRPAVLFGEQEHLCLHHARFFEYDISLTGGELGWSDTHDSDDGEASPLSIVEPWNDGLVWEHRGTRKYERRNELSHE